MMVSAMEKQRAEMQALLEEERRENITLREQASELALREQALEAQLAAVVGEQTFEAKLTAKSKVAALQSRVQALHAAHLLTDEELYRIEDIVADSCEVDSGNGEGAAVANMIALSEKMAQDGAFSRQLRRKFV